MQKNWKTIEERWLPRHRSQQDMLLISRLEEIIRKQQLCVLFQPIVRMQSGDIIGYEGLIRGPSDSPLHSPLNLFKVARAANLSVELEQLCCQVVAERFMHLGLPGKLFLNVSPESLLHYKAKRNRTLTYMHEVGITPDRVIIELTESQPAYDYEQLRKAVMRCRGMGFQIAIDDLGEGFSSLRLWSELRPDYVKIDMHFIQGINHDPVKLQFVRSIQEIAEKSGTQVIAEGIEMETELLMIRGLGISCGQGYHIARPHATPARTMAGELIKKLSGDGISMPFYQPKNLISQNAMSAEKLLSVVPSVTPRMTNNEVYELFTDNPQLQITPVVNDDIPIGLITRSQLVDHFARPYLRELYGKRPCTTLMDSAPLIIDKDTSLQELSQTMVEAERHHLSNGFIITDQGRYIGMGSGQDLMRELTQMQINAARYANPLTLLPGNVPINEHIERLLQSGIAFSACYADLDHFKPFNDVYGYRSGDDVIQMTAHVLIRHCDFNRDFIGHIGGDDFIILFQCEDWEARCQAILDSFKLAVSAHYSEADRQRGGYISEDRSGKRIFHPMVSLSIGAVHAAPGMFESHHQIAAAVAEAKKEAKKITGNSLFVERRKLPPNFL